jgi:iron complex outermembrane receptor protein
MHRQPIDRATLFGAIGLTLLTGMACAASDADTSSSLEEVVVTAQRREQNLQDVPLAVTSFSADALAVEQITSTLDLASKVPNFIALNNVGQASANVYYIRGLGQTQSFPTFEPQVGTYVDDIYIGRQNANNLSLFGVESLEVLRGPQGTLFGRNSTGGAVVVTLAKPAATFGGDAEIGYGAYGRWFGKGYVDAPITDELLTRFAVFGINDDGYVQNVTTGQTMNRTKDWGVREAVSYLPASNISWNLSGDYSDNEAENVLNQPVSGGGVNGSDRVSYSGYSQDGSPLESFLTGAKGRLGQGVDVRSYGAMSNLKITFSAGTLNFITGYRGLTQLLGVDFPDTAFGPAVPYDQGAIGQFALAQDLKSDQYSQEIKWTGDVGNLNYTAGAFYLYEKNHDDFGAVANLGILFGANYIPFPLGDETAVNDTHSSAVYAQGDYKFTDAFTLTVGARFTHEAKSLEATPNTATGGFTTADIQAAGYLTTLTTNQFTPRVALEYKLDPDLMFYASATRGFQGGGWNGLAFSAATYNNFSPETVWSYETGMRSEWLDHKLRFNANVFYEDVKDYQLLSDQGGSFVTNNAADLAAYGLESELAWRPIDPLTVSLNFGLMQATYYHPSAAVIAQQQACRTPETAAANCGQGIVDAYGNLATPSDVPKGTAALHAAYDFTFGGVTLTPNVGVQWTGSQNVGTEGSPAGFDSAYTTLDGGLAIKPGALPLTVTLECKNCTMKNWGTAYLFGYKYYNVPGFWDARVNYKF